eukprot:Seg1894.8 transcript_id=Seg1894.8/GoldUCD/mRNA.D3Y31 product="hypothetical protein" protein_id=Seg1894.8/GoldUCD/D3Y31
MSNISVTKIQGIIASKGHLSFPRLKSLELGYGSGEAIQELLSIDSFDSLITTSQLEEFYCYHKDMLPYIRNGNLGLLKKCSLATFWKEFSESEVTEVQRNLFKDDVDLGIDELIKNCPHITHLDDYTDHYEDPSYFKRGALKIFSTYGPQLKHFQGNVNSPEIAHAILEKCKNMESLDLDFLYHCNWDQSAVTIDSNLAEFGHLEKLTEVDLRLINSAEIVTEFIKRRGMNLQSFKLDFGGSDSYKIMFCNMLLQKFEESNVRYLR